MPDRFTKGFDPDQHRLLRALYGDLLPPLELITVRPGLYALVDQMFAQLGRLQPRHGIRVVRIDSRAGWLKIVTSGRASGAEDIIADAEDAAQHTCEHCGKSAHMIVKVGLESLLAAPDAELGDRLLCTDCADSFPKEIG